MTRVEMKTPHGVTVYVTEEKAERLAKEGYVRMDQPAPVPKRRGRPPKKPQTED